MFRSSVIEGFGLVALAFWQAWLAFVESGKQINQHMSNSKITIVYHDIILHLYIQFLVIIV